MDSLNPFQYDSIPVIMDRELRYTRYKFIVIRFRCVAIFIVYMYILVQYKILLIYVRYILNLSLLVWIWSCQLCLLHSISLSRKAHIIHPYTLWFIHANPNFFWNSCILTFEAKFLLASRLYNIRYALRTSMSSPVFVSCSQ